MVNQTENEMEASVWDLGCRHVEGLGLRTSYLGVQDAGLGLRVWAYGIR